MAKQKQKVLFICTHNSARSQMAEGLLNALYGDRYEVYSAGTHPTKLNPYAIETMAEIGFDISKHRSKNIDKFHNMKFDYVVTVCDHAKETCPFFPGGKKYFHQGFKDPTDLKGNKEIVLEDFRRIKDEIKIWIEKTFGEQND